MRGQSLLSTGIRKLHQELKAPPAQYRQLGETLKFLRSEIQPRISASSVVEFGSCSNGLWTSSSDADITLIVPRCNNKMKIVAKLKATRDFIHKTAAFGIESMDIVENARIPVLKLQVAAANAEFRELDISINNVSGIENSMLVKHWATCNESFVPLAFAVKQWAKRRGINDRAKGTLSTYTVLLQIVYVMQHRGLLPSFESVARQDVLEQPFEELNGYLRPLPFHDQTTFSPESRIDEGEILQCFFDTFGADSMAEGSEILDGRIVAAPTATGALVMRCPLTGKDVNILSGSAWKSIHAEFAKAKHELALKGDLDSILV